MFLLPVLLLTACYPSVEAGLLEQVQQGLAVSDQELVWVNCDTGFECASMVVPLNWLEPGDDFLEIALVRPEGSENLPPLVVNPGGPGASGVDFVADSLEQIGTPALRQAFSIVGFDPRGVGKSNPVTCSNLDLKDEVFYGQSPFPFGSEQDLVRSKQLLLQFAESCQEIGFDVSYFNTQQTARDLDLLRQLLGLDTLDYLGYSYGTELGATYAALFPENVGRFVLDGAVDPTISVAENLLLQVKGFDSALLAYATDCLAGENCPLSGPPSAAMKQIGALLASLETSTLPTQYEREVGITAALYGIIAPLYSQDSWPYLTQALAEALEGDGTTLLLLADFYNDRDIEGGYLSNINEANIAIGCADGRVGDGGVEKLNQQIVEASAIFGRYFQYPNLGCVGWPEAKGVVDLDYSVPLNHGPLVIGTTGDPATPYTQAVSLAQILQGATLLTFEGEGHTAYGGNSCVNGYVEAYLNGTLDTSEELRCKS
ncbi:MAG: hypothetical protein RL068_846 [Actinomycetota bacterium]|jgi:pimeloyl-ACP methyl ester carboxylesterase